MDRWNENDKKRINEVDEIKKTIKRTLSGVIVGIIVLIVLFGTFYTIQAGQRGVILTFGKADMIAKTEGLHMKIPIVQRVIKMDIQTQKYEADASAASKDLQVVQTQIAVNYRLKAEQVPELYTNIGIHYSDKIIQPAVQEVVKQITAKYTAEELITKRELVKEQIDIALKERLQNQNIYMETTSITNFDFSAEFNKAIEAKVTAEQNALAAKNKLEQIKVEAQQSIESAKGQAESINLINAELSRSPTYIQYITANKWDGVLPQVTGGAVPFISLGQ